MTKKIDYVIQIEDPFRAMQQLRVILNSIARVYGRNEVNNNDKELLRRVVLSSGPSDRVKVLALFRDSKITPNGKLTIRACEKVISKSYNRCKAILQELTALGILKQIGYEDTTSSLNETNYYWKPVAEFCEILTKPYETIEHLDNYLNIKPVAQN